jgi:phosphoenolpyruvate carboxylase
MTLSKLGNTLVKTSPVGLSGVFLFTNCLYTLTTALNRPWFRGVVVRKIPRTMCTQHPDYASMPQWVSGDFIKGDDEVYEAYVNYSVYGCQETMWDFEGKDVDIYVVRKLLESYGGFFINNVLGEDIFLTYRLPNPNVEVSDRKVYAEALETIPMAYDLARVFYGRPVRAIFEVIFPLTSSHMDLILTLKYYEKVVAGKCSVELYNGVKVADLIGEVEPKSIEVIPLVEDMESLLRVDSIIEGYVKVARPSYMRVFIARSDPAMNYGLVPAVLLAKIALSRAHEAGGRLGVEVYPIIGVGPTPFRGNFNPRTVDRTLNEYRGVYTFTVQSAFRYDYGVDSVKAAIDSVNNAKPTEPVIMSKGEEEAALALIRQYIERYQAEVEGLAKAINYMSQLLPPRRTRRLHVGLFGYGRGFRGVTLPRAITFVGALYSMGIPPELLGLSTLLKLNEEQWRVLENHYVNLWRDLGEAAQYVCVECIEQLPNIKVNELRVSREVTSMVLEDIKALDQLGVKTPLQGFEHRKHSLLVRLFLESLSNGYINEAKGYLVEMAKARRAIG